MPLYGGDGTDSAQGPKYAHWVGYAGCTWRSGGNHAGHIAGDDAGYAEVVRADAAAVVVAVRCGSKRRAQRSRKINGAGSDAAGGDQSGDSAGWISGSGSVFEDVRSR